MAPKAQKTKRPLLSHFQACVLARVAIGDNPTGKTLRAYLEEHGISRTKPAFYMMMGALEGSGFVEGELHSQIINDHRINERSYQITKAGKQELNSVFQLYESLRKATSKKL